MTSVPDVAAAGGGAVALRGTLHGGDQPADGGHVPGLLWRPGPRRGHPMCEVS